LVGPDPLCEANAELEYIQLHFQFFYQLVLIRPILRPTEGLVEFIKDSDIFICEGMYGDEDNLQKAVQKKHMMFSEAGTEIKHRS
jgi:hypothetical protein